MKSAVSQILTFFCAVPALLWQAVFLLLPLAVIVGLSFSSDEGLCCTLEQYSTLLSSPYWRIIGRSVWLAGVTSFICLCLGYPVAYFIAFHAQRWRTMLLFLLMLPLWTSLLVQIYAWFFLLEREGVMTQLLVQLGIPPASGSLANSTISLFLVMVYCYLPFMIMPLYTVLDRIDVRVAEASSDLGARPWQTFLRVILPLSLPGIRAGLLLVLVPAFGEFSIPALLGGGRYFYVGPLISYFSLVTRDNGLSAAFTCLSSVVLLGVVFLVYRLLSYVGRIWGGEVERL